MSLAAFIDEPILVQARLLPDGRVQPTAFTWRGRIHEIGDWGREWDEETAEVTWRCYLVRTADLETFELRHHRATGQWVLARAWMRAKSS